MERASPDDGPQPWRPAIGGPVGWDLVEVATPFVCPDGGAARLWLTRPRSVAPDRLVPVALLLHDGAFDHVSDPPEGDPLAGPSYQDPTHLSADWAARRAFATLGRWRSDDPLVDHQGALATALAERGVASLVPSGCWGDHFYSRSDNSPVDGFNRQGGELAAWTWALATVPTATDADGEPLGVAVDPDGAVLVALGDAGRGAARLLRDPSLIPPSALILDSVPDDLGVYWDDPGAWIGEVAGLERIWPGGRSSADSTALVGATWPGAVALAWSSADPALPAGAVDDLYIAVQVAGGLVVDTAEVQHVQLAGDLDTARDVVNTVLGAPSSDTDAGG